MRQDKIIMLWDKYVIDLEGKVLTDSVVKNIDC